MTTAQLFVEAVDTALTLFRWAVGWVITLATIGSILLVAAVACGAWGTGAARSRLRGRVAAEQPVPAPEPPRRRPAPHWARTQPLEDGYDEAA